MASPCPNCGSTEGPDHVCSGDPMALIGQVLDGRYKIEDVLGQGGMGMVFRATQTSVQRPVAVKTLNPSLAAAPQFFERFRREAEVASRLHHPNIITIYDFGRAQDGTCYYVMELVEGQSLREMVKRNGPLSLRRAVDIIEQACRGLSHAHEQSCIHRDIKPHNIMVYRLDGRDSVKVLDFGLVKAMEQEEEQQLTSTGQVLGTPQYMPPEQAGGEDVDHRSDLYSMGAVFYYCLTGASPYGANTIRKALTAAITQPLPTVNPKRQGAPVPDSIEDFFQKALAVEREDRFQSAQEFIDAMLDAVADLSPEELDALPTGSAQESGAGSKPGHSRSGISKAGARPASGASSRPGPKPGSGPRGSQPSSSPAGAARGPSSGSASGARGPSSGSASGARGPASGSASGARGQASGSASGSASAARQRTPKPAAPPPASSRREPTHVEDAPVGKLSVTKIALAVLALLLMVGGGAFIALRPSPQPEDPAQQATQTPPAVPAPQPTAPQMESRVLVKVSSSPAGAAIFEGAAQIGTTPADLRLTRDQVHVLSFRLANHEPVERSLDFSSLAGDTQQVEVTLPPTRVEPAPERPRTPRQTPKPQQPKDDVTVFE